MSDPQDNPDKRIKFHQHNQHFIFAFHFQALPEKSVSALTREGGGHPPPWKIVGISFISPEKMLFAGTTYMEKRQLQTPLIRFLNVKREVW